MESHPLLAPECPVHAVCPRTLDGVCTPRIMCTLSVLCTPRVVCMPRIMCTLSAVWRLPALLSPHGAPVSAPLHPMPRSSRGRKPLQPILMPSLSSFREPSVFSLL